jgi:glycine hydroxymethyltransferase
MFKYLKDADPEIFQAIKSEIRRQHDGLEMIASENFVSYPVLEAMSCVMTNKYAEGYPGKRYYGGCTHVDEAENLACDRARELFGCEHANVQPHSGSQANMAVYFSVLKPGDTVMGLDLSCGGHLTHGLPLNFSGKFFNVVPYFVDRETEVIDYDALLKQAREVKPKLIIAGASAYPRTLDFPKFREVCDDVGALLMVDIAHIAGLIVAELHPSPIPYADFVTTTTHKTLRGPRGGMIMCKEQYATDLDREVMPGIQGGPLMHIIAAKAVAFKEAQTNEFKEYQKRIVDNASALADTLKSEGQKLVSGGTDTHVMLVSFLGLKFSGKKIEKRLEEAGITVNKNTVPFDDRKPFVSSGIRVGTPALTTRGMGADEMEQIGKMIARVIEGRNDDEVIAQVRKEVSALCENFPLYPELW